MKRTIIDLLGACLLMAFMLVCWFFILISTATAETWTATFDQAEPDLHYEITVNDGAGVSNSGPPMAFDANPGDNVCLRSKRDTGQATAYSAPVCVVLPGVIVNLIYSR